MPKPRQRRETLVATIRASCPSCGDVELTSRDVTVQVCATNNQGSYAFRCPDCRFAVSKLAEQRIVDLLVSSGVRLSVWNLPAELDEPLVEQVPDRGRRTGVAALFDLDQQLGACLLGVAKVSSKHPAHLPTLAGDGVVPVLHYELPDARCPLAHARCCPPLFSHAGR